MNWDELDCETEIWTFWRQRPAFVMPRAEESAESQVTAAVVEALGAGFNSE